MRYSWLVALALFTATGSLAGQAVGDDGSGGGVDRVDTGYLAEIYLKSGRKLEGNYIQLITSGGKVRAKAKDEYSPEYVTRLIPLSDIAKIVFPGGNPDAKGVLLSFGQVGVGLVDYKGGKWRFALPEDGGELIVTNPRQVLSINLVETAVARPDSDRQSMQVLEWIYQNDPVPFGKDNNWTLDIKKVALAGNMISFAAQVWANDRKLINSPGCALVCKAVDSDGREYDPVFTPDFFKVPPKNKPNSIRFQCPVPGAGVAAVTLSIRTLSDVSPEPRKSATPADRRGNFHMEDRWGDRCKGDQWITLPTIPLSELRGS